ncbi:MAG: flagellin [Paracoccus sp. (in: a-proteobacteria)]|nr:flagellin [Paracoccus sp. (in: a-proteobacteria)]
MKMPSIGDLSRALVLRQSNFALRGEIQRLSQETTTGIRADISRHLSGDLAGLSQIEARLSSAHAYRRVAVEAGATASGMHAALAGIQVISDENAANLLSDTALATSHGLKSVADAAAGQLNSVIAALNTNIGGRFVFSGAKSDTPPLVHAHELIALAGEVIEGVDNADEAVALLQNWFSAASGEDGFADHAYRGGLADGTDFGIDGTNRIRFGQTANDPGARSVLLGLTLGALVSRGAFAGDHAAQAVMLRAGGGALIAANADISLSRADLGMTEQVIERSATRLTSLTTNLQIERNNIMGVDSYDAGSSLIQAEAQLEMLFALTARLSKLSLARYL